LGRGGEPLAMERVVALYWKPVYKFIRFTFHQDNEAAKDLTQGSFASALERDFFQRFDPSKAGFRTYLRLAVERYAANRYQAENRQKRGGGVEFCGTGRAVRQHRIARRDLLAGMAPPVVRAGHRRSADDCAHAGKHAELGAFEAYDLAEGEGRLLCGVGAPRTCADH
jgi:DNA-directed RNA polymerase specialized sigma24 family protein